MEDGKRKIIVYTVILSALLLLIILGFFYGRSGRQQGDAAQSGRNEAPVQDGKNEIGSGAAYDSEIKMAEGTAAAEIDQLSGGGSSTVVFEIKNVERQYQADDGAVIFEASLSYPVLQGPGQSAMKVNDYFQLWAAEKIREYETEETSVRQSALEVYRESRDFGWRGPWKEVHQVRSVKAVDGYLSVLLESHLDEGGVEGMPFREGHIFRLSDGENVEIEEISKLSRAQWNDRLRKEFAQKIEDGGGKEYYEEAGELIQTLEMSDVGCYFAESEIVFFLPPYEIGPYETGYVEIGIPYDEAALKGDE